MIKKIIVSAMFCLTTFAWGYAAYRICAPEQVPVVNVQSLDQIVVVSNGAPLVLESRSFTETEPTIYYYCSDDDTNCQYVNDQILPMIADHLKVSIISEIQYIDINTLDVETSTKRKAEYGFSSFPAFVIYEEIDGQTFPVSSLEFDKNSPFTINQVETWLSENSSIDFE